MKGAMKTCFVSGSMGLCALGILMVALGCPAMALGREGEAGRCQEVQAGLVRLEARAPQIRSEIREAEEEIALLKTALRNKVVKKYVSPGIRYGNETVGALLSGSLPPEVAFQLARSLGDLLIYGEKRIDALTKSVLPRLREEQTDVARQIFLLRDISESLGCGELPKEAKGKKPEDDDKISEPKGDDDEDKSSNMKKKDDPDDDAAGKPKKKADKKTGKHDKGKSGGSSGITIEFGGGAKSGGHNKTGKH